MSPTDELVEKALLAADPAWLSVSHEHAPAWRNRMRRAIEAIVPAIRAAGKREGLEEAAKECDFMAVETRKHIEKLRPIVDGPRQAGKTAMVALRAQLEACENRAAAVRALKDTP
jgi:hypothetical protein